MKSALALIVAVATAADHDFPRDNPFHASCHLKTELDFTYCHEAKLRVEDLIKENVDTESEYAGEMSLHSEGSDWIWSQRLTYNKKYTDDQLFEFIDQKNGCVIKARSKSQSLSYLDNGVNYCNMWNVISRIDGFRHEDAEATKASHCKTIPSDP